MPKNTSAIILAAGLGGRFLPASKSINKCMMPVVNKPVLQYLIEDCIVAGIGNIIVVIPEGDTQIKGHFEQDETLKNRLSSIGKKKLYEQNVEPMESYFHKLHFVEQPRSSEYGTLTSVRFAFNELPKNTKNVLILNGDGIVARPGSITGELSDVIAYAEQMNSGILVGFEVDMSAREKYGIFKNTKEGQVSSIVEKPDISFDVNSRIANMGWYLLPVSIEEYFASTLRSSVDNEFYLTETINLFLKDYVCNTYIIKGQYLDCGVPEAWIQANITVSKLLKT